MLTSLIIHLLTSFIWVSLALIFLGFGIANGEYQSLAIVIGVLSLVSFLFYGFHVNTMEDQKLIPAMLGHDSTFEELESESRLVQSALQVAKKFGLEATQLRFVLVHSNSLNAFVAKRLGYGHTIYITEGINKVLSDGEMQSVLAHEFAHIKAGDTSFLAWSYMVESFNVGLTNVVGSLSTLSFWAGIAFTVMRLSFMPYVLIYRLAWSMNSKLREFRADSVSASVLGSGDNLISALEKISGAEDSQSRWFATHPTVEKRVLKLGASI